MSKKLKKTNKVEAGKELQILLWFLCRKYKIPLVFLSLSSAFSLFSASAPLLCHILCVTHIH